MHDGEDSLDGNGRQKIRLRLDREIFKRLQATGPDWEKGLNSILRKLLEEDEAGGNK
jgi:uncharacterized protein (DUF4415 family)